MNIYGEAFHAFTNPQANDPDKGLVYNQKIADRAWMAMIRFFNEIFN